MDINYTNRLPLPAWLTNPHPRITVKSYKEAVGHEGPGGPPAWSCSLYFDDRRVATVSNDSWGGGNVYHWLSKKTDARDAVEAYVKTRPQVTHPANDYEPFDPDLDIVIEDVINWTLQRREVIRKCSRAVCYIDETHVSPGVFGYFRCVPGPAVIAKIHEILCKAEKPYLLLNDALNIPKTHPGPGAKR